MKTDDLDCYDVKVIVLYLELQPIKVFTNKDMMQF